MKKPHIACKCKVTECKAFNGSGSELSFRDRCDILKNNQFLQVCRHVCVTLVEMQRSTHILPDDKSLVGAIMKDYISL
jgi:hypothetical protein